MHIRTGLPLSSWTSWTKPRKYLTTSHLQLWNHVQEGFSVLGLLDTGMTPMVWWSVIIIQSDLAPLHRRSRIPQGGELQEVATCKHFLQVQIEGEVRFWLRMLKICVSALKSACWNFAKFGKVRSIDPDSIGDNGLVQWHHHQGRTAPQGRLSHSAKC